MTKTDTPADDPLCAALERGLLRPVDVQLARRLAGIAGGAEPAQRLAAALASQRAGAGDVCVELPAMAGRAPFPELPDLVTPPLADWQAALARWPVVAVAGGASPAAPRPPMAPLVLDGERLYLGRDWAFEQAVAARIRELALGFAPDLDLDLLRDGLTRLFGAPAPPGSEPAPPGPEPTPSGPEPTPSGPEPAPDWQRVAAATAVMKRLCVISGGPGTGKTHTVAAILTLIGEQVRAGPGRAKPRVALAAPTGKAAARLTESLRKARQHLGGAGSEAGGDGEPQGLTLHRLLGIHRGRALPRFHAGNPLHLDLLIVDEASMVDLALMARVLAALPAGARLVLLGDRDQLASVESGMVLGDLCGRGHPLTFSAGLLASLRQVGAWVGADDPAGAGPAGVPPPTPAPPTPSPTAPRRRGRPRNPPTGQLSLLETAGPRAGAPAGLMTDGRSNGAADATPGPVPDRVLADAIVLLRKSWRFAADSGIGALAQAVNAGDADAALAVLTAGRDDLTWLDLDEAGLRRLLATRLLPFYQDVLEAGSPAAALAAFDRLRVLCAVRDSPFGVAGINQATEALLARAGLIRPGGQRYWAGRPLLITANDPELGLFNGDTGLILPDPAGDPATAGLARAWFPAPAGPRRLLPARLPAAETVFAMTVHKSQGSEFDEVVLILPPWPTRAVTRELLYTGLTRARARITLVAPRARLMEAIAAPVRRTSGLYQALWDRG